MLKAKTDDIETERLRLNAATGTGEVSIDSSKDLDSIDDESVEGIAHIPQMEERKTFGATDKPNNIKEKEHQIKMNKKQKLERTMKEAILNKLSQLLDNKIKMLKKDKNYERQEEQSDPGRPFVSRVLIYYRAKPDHHSHEELDPNMIVTKQTYIHYFRISKKTTFSNLKSAACEFWEADEKKFALFDDSEEIKSDGQGEQ